MRSRREAAHWGLSAAIAVADIEEAKEAEVGGQGGWLVPNGTELGPSHSVNTPSRIHSAKSRMFVPGSRDCLLAFAWW